MFGNKPCTERMTCEDEGGDQRDAVQSKEHQRCQKTGRYKRQGTDTLSWPSEETNPTNMLILYI
jgi:hypothetical protein